MRDGGGVLRGEGPQKCGNQGKKDPKQDAFSIRFLNCSRVLLTRGGPRLFFFKDFNRTKK